MKYRIFALLAVLAAPVSAAPVFISVAEPGCEKLTSVTCSVQSRNGEEQCQAQLAGEAEKAGADSILITDTESNTLRKPSLSGVKTVTSTQMSADLYRCQAPVAAVPVAEKTAEKTVEERLLRLQDLYSKKLISDEEYQAQRQRILNDL